MPDDEAFDQAIRGLFFEAELDDAEHAFRQQAFDDLQQLVRSWMGSEHYVRATWRRGIGESFSMFATYLESYAAVLRQVDNKPADNT